MILAVVLLLALISPCMADEGQIIQADRDALAEAKASGISSKILAAKEQLSDDLNNEAERRRQDAEGIIIPLTPDGQGHLLAEVMINNTIPASMVVDTGSPVVMLSSVFVQRLGIDPSSFKLGYVEVLNGKYKAAAISLDRVQLGEAQAQNVDGVVLLQESKGIRDGLLGLSFLSRFHFTLDQAGQKLILRKLEN